MSSSIVLGYLFLLLCIAIKHRGAQINYKSDFACAHMYSLIILLVDSFLKITIHFDVAVHNIIYLFYLLYLYMYLPFSLSL